MEKENITIIINEELESPKNLKIRIPTPKKEREIIDRKSNNKKISIIKYILFCHCCHNDDDYY